MQIAIDGPASAGKSTIAKIIAKKLNYIYVDTGAMYRAATWLAQKEKVDYNADQTIVHLLQKEPVSFQIQLDQQHVYINNCDISEEIRMPQISKNVSQIAALPGVRKFLVSQQQHIALDNNVVMDGRDIGTTVLPYANVKIFLIASVHERAHRRYLENLNRNIQTPLTVLEKEISLRDYKDSHRSTSPLKKAVDAIEVDTTSLSIDQVVQKILKIINNKINK